MACFNPNLFVFIALMVASMHFLSSTAQTTHVVGDALGWTIPPGGAAAYTTWASQQTFTVGDILVFNFTNGQHDVAEVTEAAYGSCTSTNPISLNTTSPTSLTLTTPGTHYYICTFTSHCQIGQKLTINVSTSSTATPPSTTPMTPTSPPPTATPTPPSMTPTPPMTPAKPCPPTPSPSSSPTSPPTFTSGSTTPPPPGSGAPSLTVMPREKDHGYGYFIWKSEFDNRLRVISSASTSQGDGSAPTECSNCNAKDLRINMLKSQKQVLETRVNMLESQKQVLETRVRILEARLEMATNPDDPDHTCQSAAILCELLSDLDNLHM